MEIRPMHGQDAGGPDLRSTRLQFIPLWHPRVDRFCRLVVRVPGYRSRGLGSISGATRFSWEVVGLERGPISLVSALEGLTEWYV
jgi:hypothetical protein